jgi:hypothetical protein
VTRNLADGPPSVAERGHEPNAWFWYTRNRWDRVFDPPAVKVARGVELLDAQVPDWRSRIDVDHLDMNDPTNCVLGQLFGHHVDGRNAVGLGDATELFWGFFGTETEQTELLAAWQAAAQRS